MQRWPSAAKAMGSPSMASPSPEALKRHAALMKAMTEASRFREGRHLARDEDNPYNCRLEFGSSHHASFPNAAVFLYPKHRPPAFPHRWLNAMNTRFRPGSVPTCKEVFSSSAARWLVLLADGDPKLAIGITGHSATPLPESFAVTTQIR